nr:ABC transporter permease [Bacillus velezensis]
MARAKKDGEKRTFESTPIPVSDAKKLTSLQHVKNYNFLTTASANAESFDAIKSSGESADNSSGAGRFQGGGRQMISANISIEGVLSTALLDDFTDGSSKITDGRAITKTDADAKVAVINETLADQNKLKVGGSITVSSAADDSVKTKLKIVGIYKTTSSGDDQAQHFSFLNPDNKIYTPYTAAAALKGSDNKNKISSAVYYMDDAKYIDSFVAVAKKTSVDDKTYALTTNDQVYQQMVGPIENVASFSKNVVYLVSIAGAVILGLIVMMSIRERKYEMGVLMAIGEKRWKLIGQFLTEILVVAVIAIGIASVTGATLWRISSEISFFPSRSAQPVIRGKQAAGAEEKCRGGGGMFGQHSSGADVISTMQVNVSLNDLLILSGIGVAIAVIATLLPSVSVMRLHPKTILTKQE